MRSPTRGASSTCPPCFPSLSTIRTVRISQFGSGLGSHGIFQDEPSPATRLCGAGAPFAPPSWSLHHPFATTQVPQTPASRVWLACPTIMAAECPEPLCPARTSSAPERPRKPPGGRYPRRRSYGLMRQTIPLPTPPVHPRPLGLCSSPSLLGDGPSHVLRDPAGAGPLPAALPGCACPLLHRGPRSPPQSRRVRRANSPHMAASVGTSISRLQSSHHLRAPALAMISGCPPPQRPTDPPGRPGRSHHASPPAPVTRTRVDVGLPPDMLDTDD